MPCFTFKVGQNIGWACSRGYKKEKPPVCYKCGKPATCFCDFRNFGMRTFKDDFGRKDQICVPSLSTCDKPMCDACANHYGKDTDFCDEHNNELCRIKTKRAEEYLKEKYGDEDD